MAENVGGVIREWIQRNVHNYPLEDKAGEVERLVKELEAYLLSLGYTRDEAEDYLGDLDVYVEDQFEQVQDPDLGFKDPRD
ncbi:hypothetical protein [Paracoccus niistensis]|uniref:Uncharacterized protein n=1 Tax=Paracoccus niistensis TaxID=632935 RepID=A0ABV6I0S8_9RHOB